ncbi:MAG: recombination regulator RecX [Treponema sp.]|nr:recombination regulator RecX [Treponema sp.]
MKIISLKAAPPREEGAIEAEFSDGSRLLFLNEYLPDGLRANLDDGRELSAQEEEALRFAASCYRAETAALRLIARAEQSVLGLTAKLEQRGYDHPVVKMVISRLLDRDLLNDERFARLWVNSRLSYGKTQSPLWLRVSLGKKGIDRNLSGKAVESLLDSETEYALLLKYLEKTGLSDGRNESFLKTQLKSEGFSYEVLDRYFDSL